MKLKWIGKPTLTFTYIKNLEKLARMNIKWFDVMPKNFWCRMFYHRNVNQNSIVENTRA